MTDPAAKPVLVFDKVAFAYEPHLPTVLKDISFTLAPRSFTAVVGPSGSGKSTILRLAIGLEKPSAGTVTNNAKTRMVFQNGALLPWLSALENVLIGLANAPLTQAQKRTRALAALTDMGIERFANAYPRDLSGGQRQRVGIARALVAEPELLLLDEPFSALDFETTEKLSDALLDIFAKRDITMLIISHSIEDAVVLADDIFVIAHQTLDQCVPVELARPRVRTDAHVHALINTVKKCLPEDG